MSAYRVSFVLRGTMPLLMHFDNIDGSDRVRAWQLDPANKNQSVAGDDRSPAWTWMTYLYHDGTKVAIPQDVVMASLKHGGARIVLKGNKTYKELSQSSILMETEFLDFAFSNGRTLLVSDIKHLEDEPFENHGKRCRELGFSLFTKRARVRSAKHVRVRPRFTDWTISGTCMILSKDLTFERVKEIFQHAGQSGIGDWRPTSPMSPGPYGMYTAELTKLKD